MIYTVYRYDTPQCTSRLVELETLQVIVKINWQHTSIDEPMKSSQPEFYANASLSSQVIILTGILVNTRRNFDFL